MNILFVCDCDPRTTDFGNSQRTNRLWNSLKRHGRVMTFLYKNGYDGERGFLDNERTIYIIQKKKSKRNFWKITNILVEMLCGTSFLHFKSKWCPDPRTVFGNITFDIVVARYFSTACQYSFWGIAPLYVDIDDLPIQKFRTIYSKGQRPLLRWLGVAVTKLQTAFIMRKTKGTWISNEGQARLVGDKCVFLPNIPCSPSPAYDPDHAARSNLFTVGAMFYGPNYDGVSKFLKEVWTEFTKRYPAVEYYIIGKDAPKECVQSWNSYPNVRYIGFVENLEEHYQKTLATVVPVYAGGGTCIKTMESLSFGRSCLSTPFGVRGLPAETVDGNKGISIFTDAQTFIEAYEKLADREKVRETERQGKIFINRCYSSEAFDMAVNRDLGVNG